MEFDDAGGRIKGLVVRLSDRMSASAQDLVEELADHNEPMLAVEFLADDVCELEVVLTADERVDLTALARYYGSDRALRAIEKCPS